MDYQTISLGTSSSAAFSIESQSSTSASRIDLARGFRGRTSTMQIAARELHDAELAAVDARQLRLRDIDAADLVRVRKVPRDVGVLCVQRLAVEKCGQPLPALLLLARALLGFALRALALGALGAVAQRIRLGQIDLGALAPRLAAGCAAAAAAAPVWPARS